MHKIFVYLLFTLLIIGFDNSKVFSQLTPIDNEETDNKPSKGSGFQANRFVVGGYLGAQFGNFTAIDVSPLVGYRVTPKFTPGLGMTYQYVSYNDPTGYYQSYNSNIIGPRVFADYDIFYGLFAHAEYEHLWFKYDDSFITYKDVQPGLFVGGGLNLSAGANSSFQILAIWNLLWDSQNLIYGSPFTLRFGMAFGL
ncbi:MAG: hypothetical protein IPG60_06100 [Bacteroidetes bacterium]|nr:hypothetical protein [Bacteroidota bacterium]MBP7398095.1 hypothetical protein [Chitinophagales bacterium]MBK7110303.1 hypothetical protein [Bacteroidota bacterium]MBK8488411.1 hypothetical protein [Bacteroidota bacterium]MBK8681825.1 hypothetical protein [Bacteroidota bacterium]